jgi:NADH-quinone oxidoreductase subunit L
MDPVQAMRTLGVLVVALPAASVVILGLLTLFNAQLSERFITRLVQSFTTAAFLAALGVFGFMLYLGRGHVTIKLAEWVHVPGYHFHLSIVYDSLSIAFALLSLALSGVIGSFSTRYLHREGGFNRYFLMYTLFVLGMVTASVADTIETLFFGWELVGLSSALLIGFFQDRPSPVRNGLWVWVVYRVADAALLLAAVVMHHITSEGDFDQLLGTEPWPAGVARVTANQALLIGLLLLLAAAGKSGLVPFSGWLPRAMEGPTPSSAVFYGALSVHLGAFLLLRLGPLLVASWPLAAATVVLGVLTAGFAALTARVQTDIKSGLAFASLAQVGLIVAEIGLGLRWLPLIHLIGHACLRTLQFLRAPSLLQDYQRLENAVGGRLGEAEGGLLPAGVRAWLYRFALERGSLDVILWDWIARPMLRVLERIDRIDRWWEGILAGKEGDRT